MTAIQPVNVPQPVKLTIEQFELLDRTGAFDGYAKTELIEGAIYAMQGQFRPHAFAKSELAYRLRRAVEEIGSELVPIIEVTVGMPPVSAPEPDIALTSAPRGEGYAPLESVALAIEVADSTASFDLEQKAPLYARHGIPEYWVVDIPARLIHIFWSPSPEGYREARAIDVGRRVASATVPGLEIDSEGLV
jgi:Uma2 family endonuclease